VTNGWEATFGTCTVKQHSTVSLASQAQCRGSPAGSQRYLRAMASWNAVLWSEKLCSCKGKTVSQLEAPFSEASSIDLFSLVVAPSSRVVLLEELMENFRWFLLNTVHLEYHLERYLIDILKAIKVAW